MNDYKTGLPAYIEFLKKDGTNGRGVWFVADQDNYYLELRDDNLKFKVSKRSVSVYEPDKTKWTKWCC